MQTWIALFRGINVGGNSILPMAQLRRGLAALKFKNVRTYIQSGNVVFDASAKTPALLASKISRMIRQEHGFEPHVLILSTLELRAAIESNPFPQAVTQPRSLHFYFLAEAPVSPNQTAIAHLATSTEEYELSGRVFYLLAPEGIGRSKLAAKVEKHLGVIATARNYRTVDALATLAGVHK